MRNEYQANETLAASNHRKIASEARVHYTPARIAGPVEICVKLALGAFVIVAIAFLLAGGF